MGEISLFESLCIEADSAVSFALIGGDCDDYVRFLQLEWESFADESNKREYSDRFYQSLEKYKKYREDKRDWHKDFSGRDFSKLIV